MSKIILEEQVAPDTPATNKVAIYPKAGGLLYQKDDAGTEILLSAPGVYGGSGTFNSTTGVTIMIGSTLAGTTYSVSITPQGADAAALASIGPIGVSGKSTSQFTVYNLGSEATATFDWQLLDLN